MLGLANLVLLYIKSPKFTCMVLHNVTTYIFLILKGTIHNNVHFLIFSA